MSAITLGTFDILHYGHVRLFKQVAGVDPEAVVGLNTDRFVTKYRGKPPVMTYKERELAIHTMFPDFKIVPNDQRDGSIKKVLDKVKARMIFVGSDWLKKDYLAQVGLTTADMEKRHLVIVVVPYTEGISSTEIKRRINERV